MYKKILGAAIIVLALMLVSMSAFAATNTITVNSATFGASNTPLSDSAENAPVISRSDLITFNFTSSVPLSEVTLVAIEKSISLSNVQDSDYIAFDEVTVDNAGKGVITFRVPLTTPEGTYTVYVGGTDASATAVKYFSVPAASETLSGDVDGTGEVDTTDAVYVTRYAIGLSLPDSAVIEAGDVDGTGEVDTTDAVYILRYAIGLPLPSNVIIGQ